MEAARAAIKPRNVVSNSIALKNVLREHVSPAAIGEDEVEGSSLTSFHIRPNSLVSDSYGTNSVGTDAVAPLSIGSTELKANACTSVKIASGNVLNIHLSKASGSEAVSTD